jgi:hypothetical protein
MYNGCIGTPLRFGRVFSAAFAALVVCAPAPAGAAPSVKKAIWGPAKVDGRSQFPIYRDLGVRIYQAQLLWNEIAPTPPARPRDPDDPAYHWPASVDFALSEARRHGIRLALQLIYAPEWANGGNFSPLPPDRPAGPRAYSRLLEAAYGRLKRANPRNLVIGGDTFTSGEVKPLKWVKWMRLPNGRPPRMDLYGHNPFTTRKPDLRRPYGGYGYADFSDLDTLARTIDRYLGRRRGRRIRLFISEFTVPTDHPNAVFNFHVSRRTQANWLAAALRIAREWPRIYALGWFSLYDQPPNGPGGAPGDETNWGLLDWVGEPKPAYYVYKRG